MLDRIRSIINDFEPGNLTTRDALVGLGVIAAILLCGGGVILVSLLSPRKNIAPTTVPSPTSASVSTPLFQALQAQPTTTPPAPTIAPTLTSTVVPIVILAPVDTPTRQIGESCIYSDAWINSVATPIPDGRFSAYEGYLCDNGYWVIGIGDWVNKAGDWGKDGSLEKMLIKFNGEGLVIDRIFFDLSGNKIPGPTK
jgi:hypothetical protein